MSIQIVLVSLVFLILACIFYEHKRNASFIEPSPIKIHPEHQKMDMSLEEWQDDPILNRILLQNGYEMFMMTIIPSTYNDSLSGHKGSLQHHIMLPSDTQWKHQMVVAADNTIRSKHPSFDKFLKEFGNRRNVKELQAYAIDYVKSKQ